MIRQHPVNSLKSWGKSWQLLPGDEVSIRDDAWMLNHGYGIVISSDADFAWVDWASEPEPQPLMGVTGSLYNINLLNRQPLLMPSGSIFYLDYAPSWSTGSLSSFNVGAK